MMNALAAASASQLAADIPLMDWFTPGGSTYGPYDQGLVGGNDSVPEPASILLSGTRIPRISTC